MHPQASRPTRRQNTGWLALLALLPFACSGRSTSADGSTGDEGGPGTAFGFVPQVGASQDAAMPGPLDPLPCGEWGLPYASAVASSPDGALLAVAGPRRRLLSTTDWHEVRALEGGIFRTESVQKLAFAANGTVLVEMTSTEPLGFWRVDDGAFLYSLDFPVPARRARWQQVALSQTALLALSDGDSVVVWDAPRRAAVQSIAPTQGKVGALALSSDAALLAMAELEAQDEDDSMVLASERISLWDAAGAKHLHTISIERAWVTALALSPDATALAALAHPPDCQPTCDATINVYRTSDGRPAGNSVTLRATQETRPTARLSYLPGGDLMAAEYQAFDDVTRLAVIRVADGALINLVPFSGDLVFSPDGKMVSPGPSIEIRRVTDGTTFALIPSSTGNGAPTFSPDGQTLAAVDGNDIVLWRLAEGVVSTRFTGLGKNVQALAFSPDGRSLASGGKDAIVRIWNADGSSDPLLKKQGQPVTSVIFSPEGGRLLTGDSNGSIYVRKALTGEAETIWYGQSAIAALAFSPDGTRVASGGTGPGLRLWDMSTGQSLAAAAHGSGVTALAFSPDGSRLVSAAGRAPCTRCSRDEGDPDIRIWKVDGSLVLESTIPAIPKDDPARDDPSLPTHAAVWGLAFTPDGRTLVTAGPQNAGHLYQFPEGTRLGSFGSLSAGSPFAVAPDAKRLVTGSSPIEIWCAASAAAPVF